MRTGTSARRSNRAIAVLAACLLGVVAQPAAADQAVGVTRYVALGDSYTAGPGIPNQTADSGGCGRSDHNYPHLVAAALAVTTFRDVSCGSATTDHMAGQQPLPGAGLLGEAQVKQASPQLDALRPDADLVTLGIGGNDIGFGEIMLTCASHSLLLPVTAPCRHHYTRNGDELGRRIELTAPKVAAVLAAIRDRAPAARVLVVGYPVILPATGPGCWPLMPVAVGDVAWLRDVQARLNAMLAGQAAAAGATFVDTYTSSIGHDVCRLPGEKWVEGFLPTAPASPVHPNALGMANTARQVLATL
jgi:lysophospholipase L1-like esterase